MGSSESKQSDNISDNQFTPVFFNSSSYNIDKNESYSNDISQSTIRKLHTISPLKMPIQLTVKCNQCGMIFANDEVLFKHKSRYCIGNKDSNIRRQQNYLDNNEINNYTRPTLRKVITHQSPIEKKIEEVREWKNQRSILQSVQDMEDRILIDSQKTQKLATDLKKRTLDYNYILSEYEQLQAQERDLLRQMFNLQGQSRLYFNHPNDLNEYERNQLEVLHRQNTRLQQERQIIQDKLEEYIANDNQSSMIPNYESHKLLNDMKEQQDQNEKALIYLRRRLMYNNNSLLTSNDTSSLPYINSSRRTTTDDVRSLRNVYLQSDGHDANVLDRYNDLEHRLHYYEYYPWMKDYPEPLKQYRYRSIRPIESTTDKLTLANNEKEHLKNELNDVQRKFQILDSRTRQLELTLATNGMLDTKSNKNNHIYSSSIIDRYQSKNSLNQTSSRRIHTNSDDDQFDQRRHFYQSSLPILDNGMITSRGIQQINHPNSTINKLLDPLDSQTYDPVNGFVIFFDFIINFPSTMDKCRLITCLHHAQSGLGEPSYLEIFKCELYMNQTSGEQMGVVLLATRQPVPSCPPQQALTVVIEVQTTTKLNPTEPLRTNAWTKLPLFDNKNRLLSGRWKVPLKELPIRQHESFPAISRLPTFGRAELHYRLVNSKDAANQASVPLSPNNRDQYFYPPQSISRSHM
ncbi:unnamed protein product [Rotaria sordida]|uniref:Coiled-coil domain-containing protein 17 n=1 Tax=Rotaria sordida TaxID=392033 RepID=A0A815G8A6_9BILA|nr:unnamed protein product [Rotaria sordida]